MENGLENKLLKTSSPSLRVYCVYCFLGDIYIVIPLTYDIKGCGVYTGVI